jgi:hypothetical protein
MTGSHREDYFLRQVKALAGMLARLVGLRTGGQSEEARAELERAYGALLGPEAELVRRADSSTAAMLLGSPERLLLFVQLVCEEAAQAPEDGLRRLLRARAAEFDFEAGRRDPENEEIRRFLRQLSAAGDGRSLASPSEAEPK